MTVGVTDLDDHRARTKNPAVNQQTAVASKDAEYIPAAGIAAFTPLYDLAVRFGLRERRMREHLFADAAVAPGMRVVDLACGTGSFALLVKQREPRCEVVGIDIDDDVLSIARRKAERVGVTIDFRKQAITESLADLGPVDRVFASLVMHHLRAEQRVEALTRAARSLAPGGSVHVVDFGRPSSRRMRAAFLSIQLLDGFETTSDSVRGTMPDHLAAAGLRDVRELRHLDTAFGTLRFWVARGG